MGGQLELRPMMTLSLSFDHRILDGAPAAKFLQRPETTTGGAIPADIRICFRLSFSKHCKAGGS